MSAATARSGDRPSWLSPGRVGASRILAWLIAVVIHRMGFLGRIARRRAEQGAPIVLRFQRIIGAGEGLASEPEIVVTAARFEKMIACLAASTRLIEIVPLEGIVAGGSGDRGGRVPLLVTIDGGWRETEDVAAPILLAHGVPALAFVPTGLAGTDRLLWPERALVASGTYDRRRRARVALRHVGLATSASPLAFVRRLREIPRPERDALLASINAPRTVDPPAFLGWDAVRRLKSAGVAIGSQGIEPGAREGGAPGSLEQEFATARDRIVAETGEFPEAVALPPGIDAATASSAAGAAGHRVQFATGDRNPRDGGAPGIARITMYDGTGDGPLGHFSSSLLVCEALGLFDAPRRALAAARRARLPGTALLILLLLVAAAPTLRALASVWLSNPSEAHGLVVPIAAAALAWRMRERILRAEQNASWKGAGLFAAGLFGGVVSLAASSQSGEFLALVVSIWGLVWARHGDRVVGHLAVPLLLLVLAIPVPWGLGLAVSLPLRHVASVAGVAMAQAIGAPAILEGNVIHMAEASLNVDDACSGIRSLIALVVLTIVYLSATDARPARAAIVMAALPLAAVAANALRLFVTVLAVRAAGPGLASGGVHEVLGVATFLAALLSLALLEKSLRWPGTALRQASSSRS